MPYKHIYCYTIVKLKSIWLYTGVQYNVENLLNFSPGLLFLNGEDRMKNS